MKKILVIAEKPSVARDIGKLLKCTKKGDGFIYSDKYIISWAVGHLVTLSEPEDYDSVYKKWDMNTLPIIPETIKLKANPQTRQQLKVIHNLINREDIDYLICATDAGREGELIFRYIYSITKCKKDFKRLWISSLTDEAIQKGFENLHEGCEYDNLYYSAKCRSESDWLVGINATRAFTLRHNTFLSVGRVQTPTLAIIVNRYNEIINFVPEDYFELNVNFKAKEGEYIGKWYDPKEKSARISKKDDLDIILESIERKNGIISSVTSNRKVNKPPLLYDLTELQRECNKKFGLSAQETLNTAQALYEKHKAITYPRTDSRYLSDDMKKEIKPLLNKLNSYNKFTCYTSKILDIEIKANKRIFDNKKVTDHHAIIPTGKVNIDKMSVNEKKVMFTIVKRFIAVLYPDYIYNSNTIYTNIGDEKFITRGKNIVQLGWKELYVSDKNEDDKEVVLPGVKKGDGCSITKHSVEKKKTTPPSKYTEATLLGAMENPTKFVEDEELYEELKDSGIGTPATRASIIERLLSVGYITRKGKNLEPTEKGIKLIQICPEQLKSPATTGKWEKGLNKIARGEMEHTRFMGSINRFVHYIVQTTDSHEDVDFPEDTYKKKGVSKKTSLGKCPVCQGAIYENTKGYFCSKWKSGCKFTIWKNELQPYYNEIDKKMVRKILKDKQLKGLKIIMPQTRENATGDVVFNEAQAGKLKLVNIKVQSNFEKE